QSLPRPDLYAYVGGRECTEGVLVGDVVTDVAGHVGRVALAEPAHGVALVPATHRELDHLLAGQHPDPGFSRRADHHLLDHLLLLAFRLAVMDGDGRRFDLDEGPGMSGRDRLQIGSHRFEQLLFPGLGTGLLLPLRAVTTHQLDAFYREQILQLGPASPRDPRPRGAG